MSGHPFFHPIAFIDFSIIPAPGNMLQTAFQPVRSHEHSSTLGLQSGFIEQASLMSMYASLALQLVTSSTSLPNFFLNSLTSCFMLCPSSPFLALNHIGSIAWKNRGKLRFPILSSKELTTKNFGLTSSPLCLSISLSGP